MSLAFAEEGRPAGLQKFKMAVAQHRIIEIGGYDYSISEVVRDFTMMAISETPWLSTSSEYNDFFDSFILKYYRITSTEELNNQQKWAQEFVFHPEGFPKEGVINKWEGDITVAIGWPVDAGQSISYPQSFYKKLPWVEKYIQSLLPDIKEATGLAAYFIPSEIISYDAPKKVARIRIIPVAGGIFKQQRILLPQPHGRFLGEDDNDFWGGVQFTPHNQEQVDGYFLPKTDNSIGMAMCNIGIDASDEVIKSQISECLARSLGFPDISTQRYHDVILSNWGTPVKEGKPPKINGGFAAYDKFMLKLLYCPEIRKQMDKYEVVKTLLKGNCIDNNREKK